MLKAYERIRQHITVQHTQTAYSFVSERLQKVQNLFHKWLDIYELYAKGYREEMLGWSTSAAILNLSTFDKVLEDRLPKVFNSNIPIEAYVLVNDLFTKLKRGTELYVLAEGDSFEQRSIYHEIYYESLKNLTMPLKAQSEINKIVDYIQKNDAIILYYESRQYDNALSWPLLLHEALHYLYHLEQLNQLERDCPSVPWLQEALIDIYVTNFFGPAYATSLATYLYQYPHEEALSYPHFAIRLYISSRYLLKLKEGESEIPLSIKGSIGESLEYIQKVLDQHESRVEQVKDEVNQIFEKTYKNIEDVLRQKTKPFLEFLKETEKEKEKILKTANKEYPRKQLLSVEDVLNYYKFGIPVAADPRILFNAFLSKEYLTTGLNMPFIKESLKKWFVKGAWIQTEQQIKS